MDQFDLEVKGHQQLYETHRLEVVYLHAKYEKPILNDKKGTAWTQFVTDARTDRLITIGHKPQSGSALIKFSIFVYIDVHEHRSQYTTGCLTPSKKMFTYIMARTKLHFDERMMMSALYKTHTTQRCI